MATKKLIIEGMKCEKCSAKVKENLLNVPGVSDAEVDHTKGKAVVTCEDSVKDEDLCMAVVDAGFKAKVKHGLFK
jgi:copper chaperone CopZ